jgi:DNA (cytosine-5)-methyltransferase 1
VIQVVPRLKERARKAGNGRTQQAPANGREGGMPAALENPAQLRIDATDRESVVRLVSPAARRSLPTVGLFAGVGGIEKGLAAAGHESLMMCEIEPTARAVLDQHFPEVAKHDDVTTLGDLPEGTKLLAGGFPCQDLSQAGKTRGIDGMRSGLVRDALRLAAKRKVPWLLLENVPFMLQLGRGRALDVIVTVLEDLGYRWAYRVVDARAFGLPQRRERVFLVAARDDDPRGVLFADDAGTREEPKLDGKLAAGFYWTEGIRGLGWAVDAVPTLKGGSTVGVPSPPGIWLADGRMVTPSIEDAEALQGFPRGWTKAAETVAKKGFRWKLVGNAVSVPAFKWLGERLASPGDVILRNVAPVRTDRMWPTAAFNVGEGRFSNDLSKWPKHYKAKHLHEFIDDDPALLTRRATAGFLDRTKQGSLRFPPGFIKAVEAHLRRMERLER